ncbi:MAG: adenosylmethionine--8-amino-7-oxononanoate aminotransferase BioA [Bacilli bacterium]|nr:adenosylmethionine--8-amino-7-oxononanoate aminotransferase BioA [Bacilli bacterium]
MDLHRKQELLRKDRQYVWHPFTQMKDYADMDPIVIEKAEGVYLYDADGQRYYDTNSSWWVNLLGHSHPRIKQAIARQLECMDHVMFSGLTHAPGIELAEKLIEITPQGLSKVFYSDNGSTSVEVALKMSFQYWQQTERKTKKKFVFVENSYHGDTLGAVSVGGVDEYHSVFRPLLFSAHAVPSPNVWAWPDTSEQGAHACVAHCLDAVRRRFESSASEIAALIVEPMIQAAGGMIMYPAAYLRGLRELCTQFEVHLIADEVATGFGRTGRMFGCDHAGITPDLMCLSKGITAGVMPLAATLCTDAVFDAFYDDYETLKTFTHGHSFTGNPIATATALETMRIFEDEPIMEQVQESAAYLREQMQAFSAFTHVDQIRSLGMIAAFELFADKANKQRFDFKERIGFKAYQAGLKEGLFLRPLGDTLYYWLPLCTTKAQIADIIKRTQKVLLTLGM